MATYKNKVILEGILDRIKTKKNMNSDLKALQNQLDHLKIRVELDKSTLKDISAQIQNAVIQKATHDTIGNSSQANQTAPQSGPQTADVIPGSHEITSLLCEMNCAIATLDTLHADSSNNTNTAASTPTARTALQSNSFLPDLSRWLAPDRLSALSKKIIKDMTSQVIELDKSMTGLAITTDATASQLQNTFKVSVKTAKELGVSINDVIHTTADWTRLGYSLPESEELARVASLYHNISDGTDMAGVNQTIASVLRGYQLTADQAESVADVLRGVAVSFPIDSAGLGEALQKSTSAFHETNTDLSKSVALIAGADSVLHDSSAVGDMWNTVATRISEANAKLKETGKNTEGIMDSVSELRELVQDTTGFDIMKNDHSLKDVYDIIVGIGEEWNNLSITDQNNLLGKLTDQDQTNALSFVLANTDMIKQAYTEAENSAGSAMQGQEIFAGSIQHSLASFRAQFGELSSTVINSDLLKWLVDIGTTGVSAIDALVNALTPLGTAGLIGGISTFIQNFDWLKMLSCQKSCLDF